VRAPEFRRLPADPDDRAILQAVAAHLEGGGLLVYPTETIYGIGGAPTVAVVERIRELKERAGDRPFLLLIPDEEAVTLSWSPAARALAAAVWPGPLTLILRDEAGRFPPGIRSDVGGVGVRVSPHPFLRALSRVWTRPLVSTSVNAPGGAPARTAEEATAWLRGHGVREEALLLYDLENGSRALPSSVVDCLEEVPVLLREGAVGLGALRRIAPGIKLAD
jgi:L-threonylcarbamoyladenylate synthase